MRYLPLIWKGIWRNRSRTTYTFMSIFLTFILFGLLQGVDSAFSGAVQDANLDRLYINSRFGHGVGLPLAELSRIQSVPGVTQVSYATWFGGYYQEPRKSVFAVAVDVASYFELYPELQIPADQIEALIKTRTGAVISQRLADKYGWTVGDRVPLRSSLWSKRSDHSQNWSFDIVGIFQVQNEHAIHSDFLFNYAYLDEGRLTSRGRVAWFVARIDAPAHSSTLAQAIDKQFDNSTDETRTQNEQETAQALLKRFGDINFVVTLIIGAVFFSLLFLTGNTMTQSVRERIPEFAVLKTFGYQRETILGIILGEIFVICMAPALLGLLAAWIIFPLTQNFTGVLHFPLHVFLIGIALSLLLVILTGLPASMRLNSMRVVDALSGR